MHRIGGSCLQTLIGEWQAGVGRDEAVAFFASQVSRKDAVYSGAVISKEAEASIRCLLWASNAWY